MSHSINEWRGQVYRTGAADFFHSDEWIALRREVFQRDHFRCKRCDKRIRIMSLTCHHMMPRAEGGADDIHNLISLCETCHDFVEVNNLRTMAAIIGSYDAPKATAPGALAKLNPTDDDPYHRPDWHKFVYGGKRRQGKR